MGVSPDYSTKPNLEVLAAWNGVMEFFKGFEVTHDRIAFYVRQHVNAKRMLAIVIMSVRLSVMTWYRFKPRWVSSLLPNFVPLGEEIPLVLTCLGWEQLQIDTDLLCAYHNKHCWRAFHGYQRQWPWTTLKSKNRGFWWIFLAILVFDAHLKSEFLQKLLEINQDNLHMKFNWSCHAFHEH